MKKLLLTITVVFSVLFVPGDTIDLPKSARKKVMKSIATLWPEAIIQPQAISDEVFSTGSIAKELKRLQLYRLIEGEEVRGYLFLSAAPSRYNDFDLMVIYNTNLSVLDTKVLIYREDWGGEIGSKRWLKQFVNKTSTDELELGRDIQGISGATISVRSATKAIKFMTGKLDELKSSGLLN